LIVLAYPELDTVGEPKKKRYNQRREGKGYSMKETKR
jgi:hypothetical protein